MAYTVTVIPGDGVGPEILDATRRVVDALGLSLSWDVQLAGIPALEKHGDLLPQATLDSIRRNKVAIKGPLTTPIGTGFRSINVALRQELNLFASLRPCKWYPGVRSKFEGTDIVLVRENLEDLYAGIEFEHGKPETKQLIEDIKRLSGQDIRADSGISIKPISVQNSQRIVRFAFDYARAHGRKLVTVVTKSNIMKFTDGLFLQTAREVAQEYTDIACNELLVDALGMHLVQQPEQFDVLVMPNLYGDIMSDVCAGLVGGLGVAPGANYGDECVIFEAVHGSAPRFAGQNRINPMALMFTAVMMVRHLGERDKALALENAIAAVIKEGKHVTADMKERLDDPAAAGTSQVADAVIEQLQQSGRRAA